MILADATPEQRDAILRQTQALWADGLEADAYIDLVATLMSGDWARAGCYRFLVLSESPGAEPVAALKVYRFRIRLEGRLVPAGGVGAVFTPPRLRGRGHASQALRLSHEVMRRRGDLLSLLYSEIGPGFYERLGYAAEPLDAGTIAVPAVGPRSADAAAPAAGPVVRRFSRADMPLVQRLRERADAASPFSVSRDADYWGYLLARASYPTLFLGRRRWESRLTLAGDRGYLWALFSGEGAAAGARLLDLAEEAPGAAAPALLDDLLAECDDRRVTRVTFWRPDVLAAGDPRLLEVLEPASPASVVPMWLALADEVRPALERSARQAAFHAAELF